MNCELQALSYEYGCDHMAYRGEATPSEIDFSTDYLVRDNSKCVLCRRCVATCQKVQEVSEEKVAVVEEKPVEEKSQMIDLTILTVSELKELAKKKEIKGYSKMKKEELIEALK